MESLYEWIWIFYIYAFLGWVVEVAYAAVCQGRFVNRGFLNGPVCPIYGVGAAAIIWMLRPVRSRFLPLFIGSVLVTSLIELITGFLLERIFHNRWWDYSDKPFNFRGYICLEFSLIWGFASLIIVGYVQPIIERGISHLHNWPGYGICLLFGVVFAVDLVHTVMNVLKLNRRLGAIDELAAKIRELSDEVGSVVAGTTLQVKDSEMMNRMAEYRELMAARQAEVLKPHTTGRRLFRAFPGMTSSYHESVEKLKEWMKKERAALEQKIENKEKENEEKHRAKENRRS